MTQNAEIKIGSHKIQFVTTPLKYSIVKKYSYSVEPCIGQNHPLVSFEHGSIEALDVSILLDEDIDESVDLSVIQQFLTELNKIDPETRSTREVTLSFGAERFQGYVQQYVYSPVRFKSDMTPTSIRLDLSLISSGSPER